VPGWLDGAEDAGVDGAEPAPADAAATGSAGPRRTAPAVAFAVVSLVVLSLSAWFTFAPATIDPDADYAPLAPDATLRASVPGTYAVPDEDRERLLEVRADGTLVYREVGPHRTAADDRAGRYTFALHVASKTPVLRVEDLGPVFVRDAQHLEFAKETYTRRAAK
jgi:hypothetical protein